MARPINHERDAEIVEKKDKNNWTFRRIAKHYRMAVSTIHEAYYRHKGKSVLHSSVK